jgi:ubiquinone/menaquinone biosynthesis C-methylase UbiE
MTRREEWQLNESSAAVFERHLVPAMLGPLAAALADRLPLRAGERVLDVACGTGALSRIAAGKVGPGGRVIGLDLNGDMLVVGNSLPPPPGAPVAWLRGSAQTLPARSGAFHAVFCSQGLQYFPDAPEALREMRRVLAPGGRLALSVVRPIRLNPVHDWLTDALERLVSAEAADMMRAGFSFGDAEELRAAIAGAGFEKIEIHPDNVRVRFPSIGEYVQWQIGGSPLAVPVAEADESARAALYQEATKALQPYLGEENLTFYLRTNNAIALRGD